MLDGKRLLDAQPTLDIQQPPLELLDAQHVQTSLDDQILGAQPLLETQPILEVQTLLDAHPFLDAHLLLHIEVLSLLETLVV